MQHFPVQRGYQEDGDVSNCFGSSANTKKTAKMDGLTAI